MTQSNNTTPPSQPVAIPEDIQALLDSTPDTRGFEKEIREDFARSERDPAFVREYTVMQFVEDVHAAMAAQGVDKKQLAKRLGRSEYYVSRLLNETARLTVDRMAEIACALGMRLVVRLKER